MGTEDATAPAQHRFVGTATLVDDEHIAGGGRRRLEARDIEREGRLVAFEPEQTLSASQVEASASRTWTSQPFVRGLVIYLFSHTVLPWAGFSAELTAPAVRWLAWGGASNFAPVYLRKQLPTIGYVPS